MEDPENRWAMPDWQKALKWVRARNNQKIRCILDVLGENTRSEMEAGRIVDDYISYIRAIKEDEINASLTVKLSALGANFDSALCRKNLLAILGQGEGYKVSLEMDMEGTPLVDYTIETTLLCAKKGLFAKKGLSMTLALQAYLDRTFDDVEKVLGHGIKVRLVKGAYRGDIDDFDGIQTRFKAIFEILLESHTPFSVGTHDPELIDWMTEKAAKDKSLVEFGFLKGLADTTKIALTKQGWSVSEYVPFGTKRTAYETRRRRYLRDLERLGRTPAP